MRRRPRGVQNLSSKTYTEIVKAIRAKEVLTVEAKPSPPVAPSREKPQQKHR